MKAITRSTSTLLWCAMTALGLNAVAPNHTAASELACLAPWAEGCEVECENYNAAWDAAESSCDCVFFCGGCRLALSAVERAVTFLDMCMDYPYQAYREDA